uniref:Uncharacterized protein n=1 Tax=Magnetococcus massalia (strain MO-1) TaxID=451514 RepID=A0A1S7LL61_MAGMO|nr:Protein of unknown function [Candidatus Magnetococcus massalia]
MMSHLDWRAILSEIANSLGEKYDLHLDIDVQVVEEIEAHVGRTMTEYGLNPNIAKLAGHATFWIRKLKPISHRDTSPSRNLAINEEVSVIVGLALCRRFGPRSFSIEPKVLYDWVVSLRAHSHSPHGSTLVFEMLTRGFVARPDDSA